MPRTSPRPKLFALEPGHRRPRHWPRISIFRLLAVTLLAVALVAGGFLAWRVWPLTHTSAGVISQPPPGAQSTPQARSGQSSLPPLWDTSASRQNLGVRASAAMVVDASSGRVIWELHPHRKLPMASLTKLMTTLIAAHSAAHPNKPFTITPAMLGVPGYTIGLRTGQRVTERGMLAAALVASANDAANALAVHRSGSVHAFVRLMNTWAKRLHLADTRYSNPSGIYDSGNHSTAWDIAELSRRFMAVPSLRSIVARRLYATGQTTGYVSRNRLLWTYKGAIGIKTGSTTAAGNCLAAAAKRHGRTLIAVELHAGGDPFASAARLLTFGFRHDR
ncbi:MAG: D-alanyl-D-alanine carboxypeptidase family protein [Gaiellales bacterium]